jgi:membrane associated rhomboid family serine protease
MFPLNDTESNRYSNFPIVTVTIIAITTVVFLLEVRLMQTDFVKFYILLRSLGVTPRAMILPEGWGAVSALTGLFLHGGWLHLLGNMLVLFIFGRRVEDACGSWRFFIFYLLCGVCGALADVFIRRDSVMPSLGAAGAVAGVMGAYLILFPTGHIRSFVFAWFVPFFPQVRAFWIVGYFLLFNMLSVFDLFYTRADFFVGYWAHLGGFVACLSIFFFLRPEAYQWYFAKRAV